MRLLADRLFCLGVIIAVVHGRPSARFEMQRCLAFAVDFNLSSAVFEGQTDYERANVHLFNLNWPVTPAAVTYPTSAAQVASIVRCAGATGYKVQTRSGGHSYANYCLGGEDGAITIDLQNMKDFSFDATTHQVTVGGGMRLGELDEHLRTIGRTIAHGTCRDVGIGGHATVGGVSPATRLWGLTLDHIVGAEVVLADGSIIYASETEYSEVLFAVKGAAASFGVVTEFVLLTQPVPPEAVQYDFTYQSTDTGTRAQMLRDWQTLVTDPSLPNEFSSLCILAANIVYISASFFGSFKDFTASGLPGRIPGMSSPGANLTVVTDWSDLLAIWASQDFLGGGGPTSSAFYQRAFAFTASTPIPASGIENLMAHLDSVSSGSNFTWFVMVDLQGGASAAIRNDATAYAHRDVLFWVEVYIVDASGTPITETGYQFADGVGEVLHDAVPALGNRVYPGYVDPRLENAQEAYWGGNLPRLKQIKRVVDPDDVFHNPQGVRP